MKEEENGEWEKGKMRNGVSEKKEKGVSLAARMVPNMGAGGSHPQTMLRVSEETGDETEEEEEKKERKNDERGGEKGATRAAAESKREREGQEENRGGGEKGEMKEEKKKIVVVQREATQSKEDEERARDLCDGVRCQVRDGKKLRSLVKKLEKS